MQSRTCQRHVLLLAAVALSAAIFADAEGVQVGSVATCLAQTTEASTQLDSPEAALPAEHWPPPLCRSWPQPPEHASRGHLHAGDMRQRDQGAAQRYWRPAALARHHIRLRKRAAERHWLLGWRRRQQLLDRARHRGTPVVMMFQAFGPVCKSRRPTTVSHHMNSVVTGVGSPRCRASTALKAAQ
jgi:hypothetical protein